MLLFLAACKNDPVAKPEDDTGFISKHSEVIQDSEESGTESLPQDSDTQKHDTAETGDPGPTWSRLDLYPQTITVGVGASLPLMTVATDSHDQRSRVTATTWSSGSPEVATVDANGTITALSAGTTLLHAEFEGVSANTELTVRDDGLMTVTVVDANTNTGVEGYEVYLLDGTRAQTDANGVAQIPVSDPGPIQLTAWKTNWAGATVVGLQARDITLPVYAWNEADASADMHGQIDFSGVEDAAWNEIVLGLAGPSVQGELGSMIIDDLFSEDRTVTVIGFDVNAPANLFVEGTAEDYYSTAFEGPVAAWAIAGPILISDLPFGAGAGEALALMTSQLDRFSWGYRDGGEAQNGSTAELNISPAQDFSDSILVDLPPLPNGFNGTERYFIASAEEDPTAGWVFSGFGSGLAGDRAEVKRVDPANIANSVGSQVLIYNQVGGLGSGGAVCSSVIPVDELLLTGAPLQNVATIDSFDSTAHTVGITVDPRASYVRLRLRDAGNRLHDFYLDSSWSGPIPEVEADFRWGKTDVEVIALESTWGTLNDRVAHGDLDPRNQRSTSMARTVMNN